MRRFLFICLIASSWASEGVGFRPIDNRYVLVVDEVVSLESWCVTGSFHWEVSDGRRFEEEGPELSFDEPGVYRVTLVLSDTGVRFERFLFVNDPNLIADPNRVAAAQSINQPHWGEAIPRDVQFPFQGTGFHPDGKTTRLYWDFDDGTLAEGESTSHAYSALGGFEPKLFVADEDGVVQSNLAFHKIFVYEGEAPVQGRITAPEPNNFVNDFNAPVFEIAAGQNVVLRGEVVGEAGTPPYDGYWNVLGTEDFELFGLEPEARPWSPGFYHVFFFAFDGENQFDPIPEDLFIWVRDGNRPPQQVTILEPNYDLSIAVGAGVGLAGSAYDPDGDDLSYRWLLDDGRTFDGQAVDRVLFQEPGLIGIDLEVSDDGGTWVRADRRFYVNVYDPGFACLVGPPQPSPLRPVNRDLSAPVGTAFSFAVAFDDVEGIDVEEVVWDFSHGLSAGGESPDAVRFDEPGWYPVRVAARNSCGLWSLNQLWSIFIYSEDQVPPDATIESPENNAFNARNQPVHALVAGSSLRAVGSAVDVDGPTPLFPTWLLDGAFLSADFETEPFVVATRGLHTLLLSVQDGEGTTDPFPEEKILLAVDPGLEPRATIVLPDGGITIEPGQSLDFEAIGEDPNDLALSYRWEFGPGAVPQSATGSRVGGVVFNGSAGEDVEIRCFAFNPFSEQSQATTMTVRLRTFDDESFEPNGDLDTAAVIEQGRYNSLSLSDSDSSDVFRFSVPEDHRDLVLELNLSGPAEALLYRFADAAPILLSQRLLAVGVDRFVLEDLPAGDYAFQIRAPLEKRKDGLDYGISIATLRPELYLPFVVEDGNFQSEIGIVNPTGGDAAITLTGINENGVVVAEVRETLAAGASLTREGRDWFAGDPGSPASRSIKWVRVQSSTRLVAYAAARNGENTRLIANLALGTPTADPKLPHIAKPEDGWYTRAVVVNADQSSQTLRFAAGGSSVDLADPAPAGGVRDFRFVDVIEGSLPAWGSFQGGDVETPVTGVEIFGRTDFRRTAAAIELITAGRANPNHTRIRSNLYFTHIAKDRENWWTGIALINPGTTPVRYDFLGYDPAGNLTIQEEGRLLQPGEKLLSTAAALFGTRDVAWLEVVADAELIGFELFGDPALDRMAGFQAAEVVSDRLIFPRIEADQPDRWTGISLVNVDDQPLTVTLRARSESGAVIAQSSRELGPKAKLVDVPQRLFDGGYPTGIAYIEAVSDRAALCGFELFGTLAPDGSGLGEQLAGIAAAVP